MATPMNLSPDFIYQVVNSNPNLRNLVEQTASLAQMQAQQGNVPQHMYAGLQQNPMAVPAPPQQMPQQQQPKQPEFTEIMVKSLDEVKSLLRQLVEKENGTCQCRQSAQAGSTTSFSNDLISE